MIPLAFASRKGPPPAENQDAVLAAIAPDRIVGVVCDGVGGLSYGAEVANFCADQVVTSLAETPWSDVAMSDVLRRAHRDVFERWRGNGATTVVCAVVFSGEVWIGWVGDSRAYALSSEGMPTCLTLDDTIRAHLEKLRGCACPGASSALIQAIGINGSVKPNIRKFPLSFGGLILVSDGVSISDDDQFDETDPDGIVSYLTEGSFGYDAADDATALAISFAPWENTFKDTTYFGVDRDLG